MLGKLKVKPVEPDSAPSERRVDDWDEYWAAIALAVARKSKDPRCQVGAVIVRQDNIICSTGFNGFARQVLDDPALLADADEKLKWVCHAEQNAIMNAARVGIALEGAKVYVTKFPCFACVNAIIQSGVREIFTPDRRFWDDDPFDPEHTRKRAALAQAGIKVHAPNHPEFNTGAARRPNASGSGADLVGLSPQSGSQLNERRKPPKGAPLGRRGDGSKKAKPTKRRQAPANDNLPLFGPRRTV